MRQRLTDPHNDAETYRLKKLGVRTQADRDADDRLRDRAARATIDEIWDVLGPINQSDPIQTMIDKQTALGGGIVQIPPGTFDVSGLLIDSNIWLRGSGVDATVLRSTANYPVILTRTFATHTGTNDTNSEVNFKISDLTINGMKGTYSGTNGYGIRIHGANFALERLRIYDCNADGIDTEWSSSAAPPTTTGMKHSMEARLIDVEVHECTLNGITWNGPHDAMWWGVIVWTNGAKAVYVPAKGNSLKAVSCHTWGSSHTYGWYIEGGGTQLVDCVGEGSSTAQVLINCNDCMVIGGKYFAAGASVPVGIHLNTAAGYMIETKILDCTSGALKYTADIGLGWIEALVYQTSAAAENGTPHASNHRIIKVHGGGTGSVNIF